MVSGIIGNDVPRKGLRVRSPCPPLRPLAVGRFRLAMCRLLTVRPDIVFLDARTKRSGTQCNGTRTRWLFKLRRCRSMIEAVRGNLKTNRSMRVDQFSPASSAGKLKEKGRALNTALFFGFFESIRLSHGFRIELREG
jgi:hypothetical protein